MKTRILFISLLLIFSIGSWITPQKASAKVYVSSQVFYDELSPYGTWANTPYGYVWRPDAGSNFVPYSTNGNWVYTDAGWTWVSNYPWGWAPFHYGRWYTDPTYGPVWFPGYEWSPGWVTWRRSNDYYGWAAMEPGISIGTAYGKGYSPHHNRWIAKRNKDFGKGNTATYYFRNSYNGMIINNSTVINNVYIDKSHNAKYHAGPYKSEVEKHTGKMITPFTIKDKNGPGQYLSKNQIQLYRPDVKNDFASAYKPAPSKVTGFKDMKNSSQRNTKTPGQNANQATKQKSKQPIQNNTTKKDNAINQPAQSSPTKKAIGGTNTKQNYPSQKVQGAKQSKQGNPSKKGKD